MKKLLLLTLFVLSTCFMDVQAQIAFGTRGTFAVHPIGFGGLHRHPEIGALRVQAAHVQLRQIQIPTDALDFMRNGSIAFEWEMLPAGITAQ